VSASLEPLSGIGGEIAGRWAVPGERLPQNFFCRLLDTFDPYKPAASIGPHSIRRRASVSWTLPIWDIAGSDRGARHGSCRVYAPWSETRCSRKPSSSTPSRRDGTTRALETSWRRMDQASAGARIPGARGPGMGVHGDGLQRVHRQLFMASDCSIGEAIRILPEALSDTSEPVMQEEAAHFCSSSIGPRGTRRTMPHVAAPFIRAQGSWAGVLFLHLGAHRHLQR